jgi:cystathionine beta-lyase/cystathionine gamma-synthase
MSGYSGMMSFYIKSNIEGVKVFLKALKVYAFKKSLFLSFLRKLEKIVKNI